MAVRDPLTDPQAGDRLVWCPPSAPDHPVHIQVRRVATDGTWADIRCTARGGARWRKRQTLPWPEHVTPDGSAG